MKSQPPPPRTERLERSIAAAQLGRQVPTLVPVTPAPTTLHATVEDVAGQPPGQDQYTELKLQIQKEVVLRIGPVLFKTAGKVIEADVRDQIFKAIMEILDATTPPLPRSTRERLYGEVLDEVLGHGPIEPFLRDESVTEIMVNGYDSIYIERGGVLTKTTSRFVDDDHVRRIVDKIVSSVDRHIDEATPLVDARLADGSRVNAVILPLALDGTCITIRKFPSHPLTIQDLIDKGTMTARAAQFLQTCVNGAANIIVSGGTGSGKTTLLNVLSAAIPPTERIITIEDSAEMQLEQDHVIRLEARPANTEGQGAITIRDLVRNCLRMRPDRIIVGECRGGEAVDMLQAMNTGHDGSMTTIHSNGPRDALRRIETLVLMSGLDLPSLAIRDQIASALDLVVHITRLLDGRRIITHITEIGGLESGTITLQDIFINAPEAVESSLVTPRYTTLQPTGIVPSFISKFAGSGTRMPAGMFDV